MRDATEVLDRLSSWRVDGAGVLGLCPSHPDSRPSLRLDITESGKMLVYCRAGCEYMDVAAELCIHRGDTFHWPTGMQGVSTVTPNEAVDADTLTELATFVRAAHLQLERITYEGELALDYAWDRFGLTETEANELRLGVTERRGVDWWPVKRSWNAVARLVVPFMDFDGNPVGAQARALEEHEVRWTGLANSGTGASWAKFGAFLRDDGMDYVVITEGPSDALTAYGAGYSAVVIRGAALGRSEDILEALATNLVGRIVMVAGDRDAAGDGFRESLVSELTARGLDARDLNVPEPYNDLNDWRMADPDAFPVALELAIRGASIATGNARVRSAWDAWTGQAPGTHATAAEAVLWYMGQTGRDAIYVRGYGAVVFDRGRWWPGHEHKLRSVLHEAGRAARASTLVDDSGEVVLRSFGNRLGQRYFLDSVIRELEAIADEFGADDLDAKDHLLLVENGVINLRTGNLEEVRPDMLMSNMVPLSYDPTALAPRWEQFLAEIMEGDADMVGFLRRLIGYGITGSTREQCFAVFHGSGANGKTVMVEALSHVMGPITKTVPFSLFEAGSKGNGPSPELARLRGARLTLTSEGEAGTPMTESTLKVLTGSDTVTARHLYQEDLEFRPRHLIVMSTNHKPFFKGQDEGLWRRVKMIPFNRYFAPNERDHYLADTLKGEAEGILAWAVRGAVEWYDGGLAEPTGVISTTADYRQASNVLDGFYPGWLREDKGGRVKLTLVRDGYVAWCEDMGYAPYGEDTKWLGRELDNRGVEVKKGAGGALYAYGVAMTTEAERLEVYREGV